MTKYAIVLAALLISAFTLVAGESVIIRTIYQSQISYYDNSHEEVSMVVVPGKNTFGGTPHALSLTPELKKNLRVGDKITVNGKKQRVKRPKMTRGQISKAMVDYIQQGKGFPLQCRDVGKSWTESEKSRRLKQTLSA